MLLRAVILLTASIAVIGSNSLALSPIASVVAETFPGSSAAGVMVASAIYGLGTAASALLLAPQADRLGAERVLVLALIALVLGLVMSALSSALWMLCLAQGLAGIGAGAALPAIYGLAAQVASPGRESQTIGIVLTGWTFSMVGGVSLSSVLADLVHWRAVFTLLAVLGAAIAVLLWRTRDWGTAPARKAAVSPYQALRIPGVTPLVLVAGGFMTAFYGTYSFLGAHMHDVLGQPASLIGLATLSYGLGFGSAAALDGIIDRYGADRVSLPIFAATLVAYLALAAAAPLFMALVAICFFWGLANHFGLNLIVGRLSALDAQRRGAILGLNSAVTYLSVFIGAIGFRPVFDQAGFAACALLSAICILPAIANAGFSARRRTL